MCESMIIFFTYMPGQVNQVLLDALQKKILHLQKSVEVLRRNKQAQSRKKYANKLGYKH